MASSTNDKIRVFIAASPSEWLPSRVLAFSIHEHTEKEVAVERIDHYKRPYALPADKRNQPRTPFSFQRFLIPEICGYTGRAIYLDADMQLFDNIDKLWSMPFHNTQLLTVLPGDHKRRSQFSVMLLDCSALHWKIEDIISDLDRGTITYEELMYEMRPASHYACTIPSCWNSLEIYKEGETALLHYTDMNTQPWVATSNRLGYLWASCLMRAMDAGFISREEVEREIQCGNIRPSLLGQIDAGITDSKLPVAIKRLDKGYSPPYTRLSYLSRNPLRRIARWVRRQY